MNERLTLKANISSLLIGVIFLSQGALAGKNPPENEGFFSKAVKCFTSCCRKRSSRHDYERVPQEDLDLEIGINSSSKPILALKKDNIWVISQFLSPSDIVRLIISNRKFLCLNTHEFWMYYNVKNNYPSWSQEVPAIKVAFAHHWYNAHKVNKAAMLGFPKAKDFLHHQQKVKRENAMRQSHSTTYSSRPPSNILHNKFGGGGYY